MGTRLAVGNNEDTQRCRRVTLSDVLNANRIVTPPGTGSAMPVPPPTPSGPVLPVRDGQELAARVLQVKTGGALLALAGERVEVKTTLPLQVGQTLRMTVETGADGAIRLRTPEGQAATPRGSMDVIARVIAQTPGGQAAAGVARPADMTPLQASALARLAAADLPTTPTAVRGLATLLQGPTMGALLGQLQAALGSGGADPDLQARTLQLAQTITQISGGAGDGDGADLAAAIRLLGRGIEAGLVDGRGDGAHALRSQLLSIAAHDGANGPVREMARELAGQISAQALAGAASEGQYLQLPLPNGASAEIFLPDDAHSGERSAAGQAATARILLDLPNLGRVQIDAIVAVDATMARVRSSEEGGRIALADALPELRQALADRGDVHVSIEPQDPPHSLLPPPPPLGLEMEA